MLAHVLVPATTAVSMHLRRTGLPPLGHHVFAREGEGYPFLVTADSKRVLREVAAHVWPTISGEEKLNFGAREKWSASAFQN